MKIVILGAGEVGGTMAEHLAIEANDVTVIDQSARRLRALGDRLDIRTVCGQASYPSVLEQAGIGDADLLIAVTSQDEVNMVACQIAKSVVNTPKIISRIRNSDYLAYPGFSCTDSFSINHIISPEKEVTDHIVLLIECPGALQVIDFSDGLVRLMGIKASEGGPVIGRELSYLREQLPHIDARVAAIYRKNRAIVPQGNSVIQEGDEVFFIAAKKHIRKIMSELQPLEKPYRRIMIAGGGNIGERLASALEKRYQLKIMERNRDRCIELSERLVKTTVLHADATHKEKMLEANIELIDVFCAVTDDDEANFMSAMLAKRQGVRKVMALINNPDYVDLIQGNQIDIAISPQQMTIGSLLTHVRRGEMQSAHRLRWGAAEVMEAVARGDHRSSKVVGKRLDELSLPEGSRVGAIVRRGEVFIAHDHIRVQPEDRVILFVTDKRRVLEVERLFEVGLGFF